MKTHPPFHIWDAEEGPLTIAHTSALQYHEQNNRWIDSGKLWRAPDGFTCFKSSPEAKTNGFQLKRSGHRCAGRSKLAVRLIGYDCRRRRMPGFVLVSYEKVSP